MPTSAGSSAGRQAERASRQAQVARELAAAKEREARNYLAACRSEQHLAHLLEGLITQGWRMLTDRRWPGSKKANIDFILIGPGGVFILDAKHWSKPVFRGGRLFRGEDDASDDVRKLEHLRNQVASTLEHRGVTPSAISAILVFTLDRVRPRCVGPLWAHTQSSVIPWLLAHPVRLTSDQVQVLTDVLEEAYPELDESTPDVEPTPPTPRISLEAEPLFDLREITDALIESALAGRIEDWMTFLHPDQAKLVRTQYSGPARIRGSAGTGKTVVGLHRAVYLAERSPHPVLVTTYVRTLPRVLQGLARRLSATAASNIEFSGVHALAVRILRDAGQTTRLNPTAADTAFGKAWARSGAAPRLARIDDSPRYWREEIDHVIKGRGLTDVAWYRQLKRVGRNTALRAEDRERVWELFTAYQAELAAADVEDFNDILIRARRTIAGLPELARYSSVIVDEVQDLNLVALQFLIQLAGDGPDSLLLLGDGHQAIYPGGFTLSEAGISVTGRSAVLRVNYRNTAEILAHANRHLSFGPFDEPDATSVDSDEAEPTRHGHEPVLVDAATRADLDQALVSLLLRTRDLNRVPWGDIAVLTQTNRDVQHHRNVLQAAGIPTINLSDYDGVTNDCVKVGTIKRAKGLDFTYVCLPGLTEAPLTQRPGESAGAYADRCDLHRRELYVGMTRARDGLWLGYLSS